MSAPQQSTWNTAVAGVARHERLFQLFTRLRPGEARSVLLFGLYAFLLLLSYYLLRTAREPLLLASSSAEMKTYASAAAALALLFLVPLYAAACRRIGRNGLVRWVTAVFLGTLGALYLAGRAGFEIGFLFYVWAGVFGVGIVAQFWAHAADCFDLESGQRVFPLIMAGATLGGLAGPLVFRVLHGAADPLQCMLIAMLLLAATLPLVEWTRGTVPAGSRVRVAAEEPKVRAPLGGFSLILRDRHLLLLALFVVLLNCVNTMGEYLLTKLVLRHAADQIAIQPWLDKGQLVGAFYADFFLVMNVLTLITQVLLVSRVFRWIGVHGALLVLPVVALIGYGLVAFLPLFGIVRAVRLLENSGNYSLMNTARQALYLPLPASSKYEGKIATDTFFWRFGDLVPAALVFVGANWLGLGLEQFALVNVGLSFAWFAVAVQLAHRHAQRTVASGRWALPKFWPDIVRHYRPVPRQLALARSGATWLAVALGVVAMAQSEPAGAAPAAAGERLFQRDEPLSIDLLLELGALCRNPGRRACDDLPATLLYHDDQGRAQRVAVELRVRGRYRADTVKCELPALFVFFTGATAGTLFEGEGMLPLTTHCQRAADYEQYVLKEFLAYRIYNALTEDSLRVRLVRLTYRDTAGRFEPFERYAFFTEHFDSLARRQSGTVRPKEFFDPLRVDPLDIATFDLFQYAIGNTDWSVAYAHNVVLIENEGAARVTPVPYDFDFSGLVDASYATVSPQLKIRTVREHLFRGICRPDTDWDAVFAHFTARRDAVLALSREVVDLQAAERAGVDRYLAAVFDTFAAPPERERRIVGACRPTGHD